MFLFADTERPKLWHPLQGPWHVWLLDLPRFSEFHPKIDLTQELQDPSLFHSIDFTPCPREFWNDSKNPINNPVLKTKWTLEKKSNFCSEFTFLGISQLSIYMTNISS